MRRWMLCSTPLIVLGLAAHGLMAQSRPAGTTGARPATPTAKPAAPAAKPAAPAVPVAALTPTGLRTDSLNYGDDVKRIYVGDFEHVKFKHESTESSVLTEGYMNGFADRCTEYLPKNKVEIMTQECAQEGWSVNGYGAEVAGSRHCISYRTVGTGKYADPAVYDLVKRLDAAMAGDMLGNLMTGYKNGDPAGGMKKMTDIAVYAVADMTKLIEENGCSNAKMTRFQENLIRFGWGKEPIRMPGGAEAVAAATAPAAGPAKNQNYKKLVDDLIADESRAWMMNQYQPGSVVTSNVAMDAQGRAYEVDAGYSYVSMGRPYKGTVRVTFRNGTPECLYFSDFPQTCRAPSPRVISAYEKQQYAQ